MKPGYEPKTIRQSLAHVTEEAGEVVAAIGKSQRMGLHRQNPELPTGSETNIEWILRELNDLDHAIAILRRMISEQKPDWTRGIPAKRNEPKNPNHINQTAATKA